MVCASVCFLASEADSNTGQEALRENVGPLLLGIMKRRCRDEDSRSLAVGLGMRATLF